MTNHCVSTHLNDFSFFSSCFGLESTVLGYSSDKTQKKEKTFNIKYSMKRENKQLNNLKHNKKLSYNEILCTRFDSSAQLVHIGKQFSIEQLKQTSAHNNKLT